MSKYFYTIIFYFLSLNAFSQFNKLISNNLQNKSNKVTATCIKNTKNNLLLLKQKNFHVKYLTKNWIYFTAPSSWINDLEDTAILKDLYLSNINGKALADSALIRHRINLANLGLNGLDTSYTGKDVIVGVIDQGLDWNHPDFKFSNGDTRVLRYWDQDPAITGPSSFQSYGYGLLWDSSDINNLVCTSYESTTAHGTTVAGMAVGNGLANGQNKGVAHEADIIIVESYLNTPNWLNTVSDACDYIFSVADSLGKPAVINISLGTYLGSHDAKDPVGEYIDSLLSQQGGRIVVCAAGNSGGQGKYHVSANVTSDTSFVWFLNNSTTSLAGPNSIIYDLWTDTSEANFYFGFGADKPAPLYGYRGQSNFNNALSNISTSPMFDTIYNDLNQKLASVVTYREIVGANFHMQSAFYVDSTSYLYRFMTTGSGKYDIWAGSWQGFGDMVDSIPSFINYYHMPDSLQSIVSSWNCSDKVVSVGNIRNRLGHIDYDNNQYYPVDMTQPGYLSPNSSKGPSRIGTIKPDVSASGDVSLTAGPMWFLSNSVNNSAIDSGGWHVRNGGTSMASPLVAGLGALFLQQCPNATYQDFLNALHSSSHSDSITGSVPNFAFGYGKVDAIDLLMENEYPVSITPNGICIGDSAYLKINSTMSSPFINWSTGSNFDSILVVDTGTYIVHISNSIGCNSSDTSTLIWYSNPYVDAGPDDTVCFGSQKVLSASGTASTYQWSNNIVNGDTVYITSPNIYYVIGSNTFGCSSLDSIYIDTFPQLTVIYNEINNIVDLTSSSFNLTNGIPLGGTYSGTGVIGTTFHPAIAGIGVHEIIYSYIDTNFCNSNDTSYIEVTDTLSLHHILGHNFIYFPNPSQNSINFESNQKGVVSLYSNEGKLIYKKEINAELNYIDVSTFAKGIYTITFETAHKKSSARLLIN